MVYFRDHEDIDKHRRLPTTNPEQTEAWIFSEKLNDAERLTKVPFLFENKEILFFNKLSESIWSFLWIISLMCTLMASLEKSAYLLKLQICDTFIILFEILPSCG